MLNFLKKRSVGYFIVLVDAILALVTALVFFPTYGGAMANGMEDFAPVTIGIFLLAGFVVEAVVLVLPQYRFIHLGAIALFGLSLYKEIIVIPPLIADFINNVHYQGGDLGINIFYLVMILLIIMSGIVAMFLGFYRDENDLEADEPIKAGETGKLIKVGAGSLLLIAAVIGSIVTSTVISGGAMDKRNQADPDGSASSSSTSTKIVIPEDDPITDEVRERAEAIDYDFDPSSVIIKQEEEYDFNAQELKSLKYGSTRADHNLVYVFENEYSEGYQGQYNTYKANIYLWDDGLFAGKSHNTEFKGYWYNSSIDGGQDEDGNDIADCLNMQSNTSHYESIITKAMTGFYSRQAYIYLHPGWGDGRSVVVSGYLYYPDADMFISVGHGGTFKVGEKAKISANRILKNLSYGAIIKKSELHWDIPGDLLEKSSANQGVTEGKFAAAGEYEISVTWGSFSATKTIVVEEAEAE